jgi:CubicO group peptidase (beta-lactamase class C family)
MPRWRATSLVLGLLYSVDPIISYKTSLNAWQCSKPPELTCSHINQTIYIKHINITRIIMLFFGLLSNSVIADLRTTVDVMCQASCTPAQRVQEFQKAGLWLGGVVGPSDENLQFFGETVPGSKVVPDEKHVYDLGSVSKTFTGILFALCQEWNLLKLDDEVQKHFSELKGTPAGSLKLIQLATHSSGLPRNICSDSSIKIGYCTDLEAKKPPAHLFFNDTQQDLLEFLKAFKGSATPKREYSNLGFSLLGRVLEIVSNKPFDQLLGNLTSQLGMTQTKLTKDRKTIPPSQMMIPYNVGFEKEEYYEFGSSAPAAGIFSSGADMKLFLAANINPAQTPLGKAIKQSQVLGLGWDSEPNSKVINKHGAASGFRSAIHFSPETKKGNFYLSNMDLSITDKVCIAPYAYETNTAVGDITGSVLTESQSSKIIGTYTDSSNHAKFLLKKYLTFINLERIHEATNYDPKDFRQLHVTVFRLMAKSDTEFVIIDKPTVNLKFTKNAEGNITGFSFSADPETTTLLSHLKTTGMEYKKTSAVVSSAKNVGSGIIALLVTGVFVSLAL